MSDKLIALKYARELHDKRFHGPAVDPRCDISCSFLKDASEIIFKAMEDTKRRCSMIAETYPEGFALGSKIAVKIRELEIVK
jgi:hypothetical protein